jgi:PAS domain-containing protein
MSCFAFDASALSGISSMHAFLSNGGAAGARIHASDWTAHPLGPIDGWPAALRTALGMVLGSSFPTFLAWGPQLHLFYNDAYEPLLGNKSLDAIGRPLPEVWAEVWDVLTPYAKGVMNGESFFFENFATRLERHGYPEQAWFTFSYSPVRDELGVVRGLLCTVIEVSDKVRALARHKEAEERLALSLEASGNIGTWSYDLETGATHVDERFARLFQVDAALAREGTELSRFTDMIHPEDRPRVLAAIDTAIRTRPCTTSRTASRSATASMCGSMRAARCSPTPRPARGASPASPSTSPSASAPNRPASTASGAPTRARAGSTCCSTRRRSASSTPTRRGACWSRTPTTAPSGASIRPPTTSATTRNGKAGGRPARPAPGNRSRPANGRWRGWWRARTAPAGCSRSNPSARAAPAGPSWCAPPPSATKRACWPAP